MINFEHIIKNYKFFVDTCSLMHDQSEKIFFKTLPPLLIQNNKRIILPRRVIDEVERLRKHINNDTRESANKAFTILREYIHQRLLDIRGEPNDPFTDNVFHYVFSKFKTQFNLCLLTQDVALSKNIASIDKLESIKSDFRIKVLKITPSGEIVEWDHDHFNCQKPATSITFPKSTQVIRRRPSIIPVDSIPSLNDRVYSDNLGSYVLKKEIGVGGEGKVYQVDQKYACKIYFDKRITNNKIEKISLMCSKAIEIDGVCWPLDLVKNMSGQAVGYIMPMAKGLPMQRCMFIKPLLYKYFPDWKREHLVSLAKTISEKIKELHKLNVLIGDINPLNILIESHDKVYFVDTDSYQIGHFPCSVGMINYTAPEIQGKNFSDFLRTERHELFAVATLLFMILLPGKPPYSHQGGGSPGHNIKKGRFSYPLGEKSNKRTPDGPWRFIWSNLPFKIKETFYDCFRKNRRPTLDNWIDILSAYQHNLQNEYVSNEIFPTSFKRISHHAQHTYGAESNMVRFVCDRCNNAFEVHSDYAKKMERYTNKLCRNCAIIEKEKWEIERLRRTTGETLECIDCGNEFLFSLSEQDFFKNKGFDPPIRCKDCRSLRRDSKSDYSKDWTEAQTDTDFDIWDGIRDIWNFITK